MVEWTGSQQLLFLLQSGGLGFGLGFLFDVFTGLGRTGSRCQRFWLDSFFGILAALITFFGSLAIMDGVLHPLLFAGILVGFLAEHASVGWLVSRWLFSAVRWSSEILQKILDVLETILQKFPLFLRFLWEKIRSHRPKCKKNRKKIRFFQKNT